MLYDGVELDELWRVGRGEMNFREFRQRHRLDEPPTVIEPPKAVVETPPPVIKEKPKEVKEAPPPPPPPTDVELGASRGLKDLDARALIKPTEDAVPLLSAEKKISTEKPMDYIVQNAAIDPATKWRRLYNLGSQTELFVSVSQQEEEGMFNVTITTDAAFPFVLHWGVGKIGYGRKWTPPSEDLFPPHLTEISDDKKAADTIFGDCQDEECDIELIGARVPLQRTKLRIPWDAGISNLLFVLRSADRSRWYKDGHSNFVVPLPGNALFLFRLEMSSTASGAKGSEAVMPKMDEFKDELTRTIVDLEVGKSGWTLMHRFHSAADMLEGVCAIKPLDCSSSCSQLVNGNYSDVSVVDGAARIYIWLRYSATRQLTWQRNYNTKPRELAHAQDKLTHTISGASSRDGLVHQRVLLSCTQTNVWRSSGMDSADAGHCWTWW